MWYRLGSMDEIRIRVGSSSCLPVPRELMVRNHV